MRHVKVLGLCLVAVLALAAMTASGASAKVKPPKPGLVLKHNGTPVVANVQEATAGIFVDGCVLATAGKITVNENSKDDAAAFSEPVYAECSEGSISGTISSVKLSKAGVMSFVSAVKVDVPGPCDYTISKFSVNFTPEGGVTFGSGEATKVKLAKGHGPSCAAKPEISEAGVLTNIDELAPFETAIS